MAESDVRFLGAEQMGYLVDMAERARDRLSHFAGYEVGYDAPALQLLDEWIERVMEDQPQPSQEYRILWMAFLGETFRRRFEGEWVMKEGDGKALSVLCPAVMGGLHVVEVARQIQRRIKGGFKNSLSLFYLHESIQLRQIREAA